VICTVGTAHIWSPKVLRAAMGAHRHLHFYEGQTLEDIKNKVQIPLLATASSAQQSLYALEKMLQKPLVWVLGNEGQGVSQELLAFATQVRIPQNSQVESLNVAVSAAVCLYETQRIRGNLG
jgi:TrmH family RNA methyltransferase